MNKESSVQINHSAPTALDGIVYSLEVTRAQIKSLKEQEVLLEQQIVEQVGAKSEGSYTKNTKHFKVSTNGNVRRTIDPVMAVAIKDALPPEAYENLFTWKPSLRTYRDLVELHPEQAAVVNKAITSKPGKTSVKVERIEAA